MNTEVAWVIVFPNGSSVTVDDPWFLIKKDCGDRGRLGVMSKVIVHVLSVGTLIVCGDYD